MKMPAFTAEASLYKPRRSYRMTAAGSASTVQVTPQGVVCTAKRICVQHGSHTACVTVPDCHVVPTLDDPTVYVV
jgi:hypothetical protein